jgi:ribosomal protein S18 acetylase RimI-like enzyme
MQYRSFMPEDFDSLYAIEEMCFQPPLRFSRGYLRRLIDAPNGATCLAEENGRIAGFAVAEWTFDRTETNAYLQTIEVASEFRNRGVASELLRRVESSARAACASTLWLHVDAKNGAAIRLYEKHGYGFFCEEDHYYGPGRGALIYQKRLQEKEGRE